MGLVVGLAVRVVVGLASGCDQDWELELWVGLAIGAGLHWGRGLRDRGLGIGSWGK